MRVAGATPNFLSLITGGPHFNPYWNHKFISRRTLPPSDVDFPVASLRNIPKPKAQECITPGSTLSAPVRARTQLLMTCRSPRHPRPTSFPPKIEGRLLLPYRSFHHATKEKSRNLNRPVATSALRWCPGARARATPRAPMRPYRLPAGSAAVPCITKCCGGAAEHPLQGVRRFADLRSWTSAVLLPGLRRQGHLHPRQAAQQGPLQARLLAHRAQHRAGCPLPLLLLLLLLFPSASRFIWSDGVACHARAVSVQPATVSEQFPHPSRLGARILRRSQPSGLLDSEASPAPLMICGAALSSISLRCAAWQSRHIPACTRASKQGTEEGMLLAVQVSTSLGEPHRAVTMRGSIACPKRLSGAARNGGDSERLRPGMRGTSIQSADALATLVALEDGNSRAS